MHVVVFQLPCDGNSVNLRDLPLLSWQPKIASAGAPTPAHPLRKHPPPLPPPVTLPGGDHDVIYSSVFIALISFEVYRKPLPLWPPRPDPWPLTPAPLTCAPRLAVCRVGCPWRVHCRDHGTTGHQCEAFARFYVGYAVSTMYLESKELWFLSLYLFLRFFLFIPCFNVFLSSTLFFIIVWNAPSRGSNISIVQTASRSVFIFVCFFVS